MKMENTAGEEVAGSLKSAGLLNGYFRGQRMDDEEIERGARDGARSRISVE